ncbi:helix-turn-helix domain-containing protein [Cytobacillus sp. FJAT-54145]|uniref:Helix-turn-helix domain-containing protein n=1 Tax=Cytobacillus spartinae TaxID=3299023 RepID=A0ABW6KHP7_9BACI
MKKESKADVLLHPVRLKIVQEFLGSKSLTSKDLLKRLPSVPQATLYRQIDKLVQSGILTVVEENQVRGTIEKVFSLNFGQANLAKDDLQETSKEEHLNYFMLFISQILKSFEEYIDQKNTDFEKDGLGYRQVGLYLTDEEFKQFAEDMGKAFKRAVQNEPTPDRKKRVVSTIIIPDRKEER